MELSAEELKIKEKSILEINTRKDELISKFITSKNPIRLDLVTFFMAGSPGSGKTEFSKRYMSAILERAKIKLENILLENRVNINYFDSLLIRIDVDEIREFLSLYQKTDFINGVKGNAHVLQAAANKGLDILRNYCFKNSISFLHDGTFSNLKTMREIIKKSIKLNRSVQIFYLYIDPVVAWQFTQARECVDGRNILKEKFIEQYFQSKKNVDIIKKEFGNNVIVTCVLKNNDNEVIDIEFDVNNIDKFLKRHYSKEHIKEYTEEDLRKILVNIS